MFELALAAGLATAGLALLAATGRLHFVADEFPTAARRLAALLLFWLILLIVVFLPTVSPNDPADIDFETLWFPSLFFGQALLAAFLFAWWRLAPQPPARFLALEHVQPGPDLRVALQVSVVGWCAAIAAGGLLALVLYALGLLPAEGDATPTVAVSPMLFWLADLPLWRKLVVVAVAMTVEEAFYRAFLQRRVGWITSSVLFALSHAGYGMPTLMASVFVVSLALGWALRRSGNLLPCIVAHGIFDAVQLLVVMPLVIDHMRASGMP